MAGLCEAEGMTRSLSEFAHAVAANPAPASGSAMAYGLALAAGLAQKVAARSPEVEPSVCTRAEELREEALRLVVADQRAVEEMLAGGAPTAAAIEVPRQIGVVARGVQQLAERLVREGEPWLHADAVGAVELALAAQRTVNAILRSNGGA